MTTDTRPGRATALQGASEGIRAPTCMTVAEYHAWLDADAATATRADRPCADGGRRLDEGTCNEKVKPG